MFKLINASALLLAALLCSAQISAQQTPAQHGEEISVSAADDLGMLQAELAKVEAERQRLADQLSGSEQSEALEQLQQENEELRNNTQATRLNAQTALAKQQQRWFMVGGLTVALSLLLGFVLARTSHRKRNEWLN